MRSKWLVLGMLLLVLAFALAACGGDDDNDAANTTDSDTATPTTTGDDAAATTSGGFNPSGPSVSLGAALGGSSDLPGCSDPNDEECPTALTMDLDGEVSAEGVTINYPARYFDVLTGEQSPDALIQIVPSVNNKYAETAIFSVLLVASPADALASLTEPESAEWSTDTLTGTIAVSKDTTQDPPINTTVGAFTTADGQGVVVSLVTTGKYGWDLWANVYAAMVDSLVVTAAE